MQYVFGVSLGILLYRLTLSFDSVVMSTRNIWLLSLPEILLYLFRNFVFRTVTLSCNSVIIV